MNFSAVLMELLELLVCSKHLLINETIVSTKIGRHCCLWCHIQQDQLKLVPSTVPMVERSLETIIADNQRFMAAGGNVKRVKEFNSALHEPFFNLPLDQVHTSQQL